MRMWIVNQSDNLFFFRAKVQGCTVWTELTCSCISSSWPQHLCRSGLFSLEPLRSLWAAVLWICLGSPEFLLIGLHGFPNLGATRLRDNRGINHHLKASTAARAKSVYICRSPSFPYFWGSLSASWLLAKTLLLSVLVKHSDHAFWVSWRPDKVPSIIIFPNCLTNLQRLHINVEQLKQHEWSLKEFTAEHPQAEE